MMCTRCGAQEGAQRYCAVCGLDRAPQKPVLSINEAAMAADRERQWLTAHTDATAAKTCPDCAEQVQVAAKVCRFCGYRFDTGRSAQSTAAGVRTRPAPATPPRALKSPGGGAALGILIAGLGHFYVGEVARGLAILASLVMAAVGVALLGAEATPVALAFVALSARDAYKGAQRLNDQGWPARPVSGLLWGALGLGATILIVGMIHVGSEPGGSDTGKVEAAIQPELERQLQARVPDATVTVESVDCVSADDTGGTCLAKVRDDLGNDERLSISYTVDTSSGDVLWQTDQ